MLTYEEISADVKGIIFGEMGGHNGYIRVKRNGTKYQLNSSHEIMDTDHLGEEGLGMDSLDVTEIVMSLEEKYGIEIPEADFPVISRRGVDVTINNLLDYVSFRLGVTSPSS